jgi:sec-independent protein translocase protein TatA
MGSVGLPELAIVLVILLLVFGPKRLPGLGRQLGSGMREFKESITGKRRDDDDDEDDDAVRTPLDRPDAESPSTAAPVDGEVVRERR